jgi:hypothetical protein
MQVASFSLAMKADSQSSQLVHTTATMTLQPPAAPASASPVDQVSLSAGALAKSASAQAGPDTGLSPGLSLIKSILEAMLGIQITIFDGNFGAPPAGSASPAEAASATAQGPSGTLTQTVTEQDSESLRFTAAGSVTTTDGKQYQFSLDVGMQHSAQTSDTSTKRIVNGAVDPLMITLGGNAGSLSGASVAIDLLNDGHSVNLPFPADGGWLVLDRNGNGQIDDGSELFGPKSGNGFQDLAALDSNHDGVIDASDAAYAQLKLWTGVDASGKDQMETLQQAQIGAILLPSCQTAYTLDNAQNQPVANLSGAGVYLRDDGQAGLVSNMDVMG